MFSDQDGVISADLDEESSCTCRLFFGPLRLQHTCCVCVSEAEPCGARLSVSACSARLLMAQANAPLLSCSHLPVKLQCTIV